MLGIPTQYQNLCLEPHAGMSDLQSNEVKPTNQVKKAVSL